MQPNKRNTIIWRRADMTSAQFHHHWSGPHADIARHLPDLVWYIQNHVMRTLHLSDGMGPAPEGIAEIAYGVTEGILTKIDNWDRVAELREDEGRFLSSRLGCWSLWQPDSPAPSLRRVVCYVNDVRPEGLDAALEAIAEDHACHAEWTVGKIAAPQTGEEGRIPDAFVFIELPLSGDPEAAIAPLIETGVPMAAFLTSTEAKRVPLDP